MLSSVLELLANFKSTYFTSMNTPNVYHTVVKRETNVCVLFKLELKRY